MSDHSPYRIPKPPGRWRAIILALVMHVALFLFFWIGIRWQNETPLTVEAEIWDPQYKEAAPLPTPPEPVPQPQPEPPKPQPEPQPAPPPKVVEQPKVENPEIALEREKEKKRKEEQEQARLKEEQKKKEREAKEKAEKDKAEREKKEQQDKLEAEKQKKLKEEQKKKEEDAKKKADAEKQAADKKKAAADAKAAEQRRQEDLKRMMGQATSSTGGSGTAEKSQGPRGNPDYANKLRAKIRSNTIFDVPANLSGNPAVEYTVELFPDGTVRSVRNNRQSGVPGFDEAVRQAIMKSQPYPADKDGKVPSGFTFTHKPKDQ